MDRINPTSPRLAPAIRAAALAVVLFAVVGPHPAAARPVALTHAEAAAWLRAERVGNRTGSLEQSGTAAEAVGWAEWNESHHLNAHASSWWDSLRSAHPTRYAEPGHAVVATIDGTDYPVHRDGAYYYAAADANRHTEGGSK